MHPLDDVIADLRRRGIEPAGGGTAVAGGSISRTIRVDSSRGPLLLKLETTQRADVLAAEEEALEALRATGTLSVPAVLAGGAVRGGAYLAIEWIDFGPKSAAAATALGTGLARLHRTSAPEFGWHRDNFIGSTPQRNERRRDWADFYRDMRLAPQLELARRNGLPQRTLKLGDRLLRDLERVLGSHAPSPSLLHGDLWGGNWGAAANGVPFIYDPAAYFGDREADLAMTRLFGGFGAGFYRAYEREWPLPPGWERRSDLYNLYHVLNHYNLFGGGYASQADAMLARLVST